MATIVCSVMNRIWCLKLPHQRSHVVYPKHMLKAILVHEKETVFVNVKFSSKVLIVVSKYNQQDAALHNLFISL